jgi:hypothetical protein
MTVYVVGYRPRKLGEIVQGQQLRPSDPPDSVVAYSRVPGSWVIGDFELANTECRILSGMHVNVGLHYCQFEVETLAEGKFAIACKSHPELPVQDEISQYGELLAAVAGPAFEGRNKYAGNQLPYRWEFRTVIEPIQYVATIELTSNEVLEMNGKSPGQRLEYLRSRFSHLFQPGD